MLARVVRLLVEAVDLVVVAAAVGQRLPFLNQTVRIARDRRANRGPLEGIAVGLAALEGKAERAFVIACDAPLLVPDFVRRMVELSAGFDIAVPEVSGFAEPLAAVYSTAVLPHAEALLADGLLRPAWLFDRVRTRRVSAEELRACDPQLFTLRNINSPEDYHAALRAAGC
jgi:molybdopterin-guanine dinucleotide biosynthesis protein A